MCLVIMWVVPTKGNFKPCIHCWILGYANYDCLIAIHNFQDRLVSRCCCSLQREKVITKKVIIHHKFDHSPSLQERTTIISFTLRLDSPVASYHYNPHDKLRNPWRVRNHFSRDQRRRARHWHDEFLCKASPWRQWIERCHQFSLDRRVDETTTPTTSIIALFGTTIALFCWRRSRSLQRRNGVPHSKDPFS